MSYKRFTTSCLQCKREISNSNFWKHLDSKNCTKLNFIIRSPEYEERKSRSNCIKCGKYCKSFTSLTQHEIRCGINNKTESKQCIKCGEIFVASRRKFCSDKCSRSKTVEQKQKHAEAMKRAVHRNPKSFSGGYNRGRVKTMVCSNGFVVLGNWERSFVEFCIEHDIKVEQPNSGFSYQWNGKRTYFPDFYLPETDQWVEIKGLQTERDLAKWQAMRDTHKKDLLVLGGPPSWILTNDRSFMRRML